MKLFILSIAIVMIAASCKLSSHQQEEVAIENNATLATLLDKYYEERLKFFPWKQL
jgi:hypothetical protein